MSLYAMPRLDEDDLAVVGLIEDLQGSLRHQVRETRRWFGLLRRVALARSIRGSNSIEGYHVTLDDAFAALGDEEPLDATDEAWAAVSGYRDAMTFVLQLVEDDDWEYDENLLRSLHYMMINYDLSKRPGRWRTGDVFVVNEDVGETVYAAPPAEMVRPLVQELLEGITSRSDETPVMVRAAMAHLNLVMIHPFKDGNGRMARALQALMLAKEGVQAAPEFCSIEEYLGRNEQAYYDVLAEVGRGAWHPENDSRPWLRFTLTAHYRQATTVLRRAKEAERFWQLAERETSRLHFPERMIAPLHHAVSGRILRNVTYRAIEPEVSYNVASRDLKALVDANLLQAHGEKRGRYYTPVERLRAEHGEIKRSVLASVKFQGDPYEVVANRENLNQLTLH
jgi:Fic family protein